MGEASGLESKVNETLAEQAAMEARRQALQQRIKRAGEAQRARDKASQGTPPEEAWGDRGAQLCTEFIEYARKKSFVGSVAITGAEGKVRGYPIGYASGSYMSAEEHVEGHDISDNAYLCEDGDLRLTNSRSLPYVLSTGRPVIYRLKHVWTYPKLYMNDQGCDTRDMTPKHETYFRPLYVDDLENLLVATGVRIGSIEISDSPGVQ